MSPRAGTGLVEFAKAHRRGVTWAAVAVVVGLILVVASVGLLATSGPAFLGGYHALSQSYDTLESSVHTGIPCEKCHVDPRGAVAYRASLVGDFYAGLVSNPKQPRFVKMSKPTSDACLSCHRDDWSMEATRTLRVPHPAHLRVVNESRDCVGCHKWTAHEESYMQKHEAMPFSTVCASFGCHVGWKQADECASCHHSLQGNGAKWKDIHPQTVRASGPNACLESCHSADQCRQCHTTGKRPTFSGGGVQTAVSTIEREHVKTDWVAKHGGFALADQSKCLLCHVSEGECRDCHSKRPAFHGPQSTWLGKHKDVAKTVTSPRCLTCHEKKWCEDCHKQFKEMR